MNTRLAWGLVPVLVAVGCGSPTPGAGQARTVEIDPTTAGVRVGTTQQFRATARTSSGETIGLAATDIAWSSSDRTIATVDANGLATGLASGSATIRATVGPATGSAVLTVAALGLPQLTISPTSAMVNVGATAVFRADARSDDGSREDVTDVADWASADDTVATVSGGVATGVAPGTTTVTASFGGLTSNPATVVVSPGHMLTSIQVTPASWFLEVGDTRSYTATGFYDDGLSRDLSSQVTWASSDPTVASISTAGLATGLFPGTVTITASLGGVSSNGATLLVQWDGLVAITLSPASGQLVAGSTRSLALTATGIFDDGTSADVTAAATWMSSDVTIATVSNSDPKGVVFPSANMTGQAQITARLSGVTSSPAIIDVTTSPTIVSVDVTPTSANLFAGTTQQLHATATHADNHTTDVSATATWTSDADTVATVDPSGLVTALSPGSAHITATVGATSGSSAITVSSAPLVSIEIAGPASLAAGTSGQFVATGTFADESSGDITATVSSATGSTSVATILGDGSATGVATGTTTVTATDLATGVSASVNLVVTAADLVSVTVTPDPIVICVVGQAQMTAIGDYTDGTSRDITGSVTWTSGDPEIVAVSSAGLVTGLMLGGPIAVIATASSSISGQASVTVSGCILESIEITPLNPAPLGLGGTQQFTLTGLWSDGMNADLTADANTLWSSSNEAVATISNAAGSQGLVTPAAPGSTDIGAVYTAPDGTQFTTIPVTLMVYSP